MAAVSYWLAIQVQDSNSMNTTLKIYAKTSSGLLADAQSFAGTFLTALDAALDSFINKAWFHIPIALPGGLKTAPVDASADNMVGGLETWDTTVANEPYSYTFPGLLASQYLAYPRGNLINTAAAEIAAVNTLMTSTTNNTAVTDEDYNQLASGAQPLSAIKRARKYSIRKRRAK